MQQIVVKDFLDSSGGAITASEYNIGYWRYDQYTAVEYATNHTTMNTSTFNGDSVVSIRQSVANPYDDDRYTTGYSSRYMDLASPRERAFYGLVGLKNVQRVTVNTKTFTVQQVILILTLQFMDIKES